MPSASWSSGPWSDFCCRWLGGGISRGGLDKLINEGSTELNPEKRVAIYKEAFKRISDQAYVAMLFTVPAYNVSAHSVSGPGLTNNAPEMLREDVTAK